MTEPKYCYTIYSQRDACKSFFERLLFDDEAPKLNLSYYEHNPVAPTTITFIKKQLPTCKFSAKEIIMYSI